METTDDTLLEMRQQLKQLHKTLDTQNIVNERMLLDSIRKMTDASSTGSGVSIILLIFFGLIMLPTLYACGISIPIIVFAALIMTIAIVAGIINIIQITDLDGDLAVVARYYIRLKQRSQKIGKIITPVWVVWLLLLLVEMCRNMNNMEIFYALLGALIGSIIALCTILKRNSDLNESLDSLISEIEKLTDETK